MSALVTQETSDQPEVVFFTEQNAYTKQVIAALSTQGVTISCFTQEKIQDEHVQELCQRAYRVLVWLDPTKHNELERIASELGQLSQLQFVIPLITPCSSPAPELKSWNEVTQRQIIFLSQLTALFPQTQCVFLLDVLEFDALSPLAQMLEQMPQKQLFAPELSIAPCSLQLALDQMQHFIFHPSRSSIVIQGTELSCETLLSQAKTLYENIHQVQIALTTIAVATAELIPFHVSLEQVRFSLDDFLKKYSKTLPSPQQWRPLFALPTFVSTQPVAAKPVQEQVVEQSIPPEAAPIVEPEKKDVGDVISDITSLFANSYREHKTVRTKKVDQVVKVITKKKKKNTALFLIGLVSTGVTLGLLFLSFFFWLSVSLTQRSVLAALPYLLEDTPDQITQSAWQQRWYALLTVQVDSYGSLLDIPMISKAEKIISLAEVLREYHEILPQALQTEQTLVQHLFGQTDSDISLLAQNATTQSQKAYELLATLESELFTVLGESSEDVELQTTLSDKLTELRSTVGLQQQLVPLLPALSGVASKQTYAIIFQNSQELRPTGGFLQSLALVTLAQGSVIDVQTLGSSELDAGIGGSVTPPQDVERLLGESNWFARDANWDPDFPTTATTLRWFVDRSRNVQLAGVIAVDTQGLADVIEALGPVDVPEYNEVITHKNLFERLEYHSEVVLVPESGTKDYSAVVLERVLQKMLTAPIDKFPAILSGARLAAEQQHLLFAFTDESNQAAFAVLGWSGSILQPPCPSQLTADTCVVEPFYQVEANIGINKANYYLKRDIAHETTLTTSSASHTRTVEYQNTAQSSSWPKGPYRAFVRYYLAPGSTYEQLLLNGSPISVQDLSLTTEHNRTLVGAVITVPVGGTLTTQLSYSTPLTPSAGTSSYVFFNQKQPGTNAAPLSVSLSYPPELQPERIAPQAELTDTTINFTDKEEKSRMYGAKFF